MEIVGDGVRGRRRLTDDSQSVQALSGRAPRGNE